MQESTNARVGREGKSTERMRFCDLEHAARVEGGYGF